MRNFGNLQESNKSAAYKVGIQAYSYFLTSGLRTRPLGTITVQVTGGNSVDDTYIVKDDGVAIMASVGWDTSHANTASLIATAINAFRVANPTVSNWVATVSSDTVTLRQARSGAAGTITCTVANDATVTIPNSGNVSNDTNTWTRFDSGATFDGDLYYELGFDKTLAFGSFSASDEPRILDIDFLPIGQDMQVWSTLMAVSNVITVGHTIEADTPDPLGPLPWFEASGPMIVKLAADAELRYVIRGI